MCNIIDENHNGKRLRGAWDLPIPGHIFPSGITILTEQEEKLTNPRQHSTADRPANYLGGQLIQQFVVIKQTHFV